MFGEAPIGVRAVDITLGPSAVFTMLQRMGREPVELDLVVYFDTRVPFGSPLQYQGVKAHRPKGINSSTVAGDRVSDPFCLDQP